VTGCNTDDAPEAVTPDEEQELSWVDTAPERWGAGITDAVPVDIVIPAEDAILYGRVRLTDGGYLEGFEQGDNDDCEFIVTVPADGFYDLNFKSSHMGGYKENYVYINGDRIGVVGTAGNDFDDAIIEFVFLSEGENIVRLASYWGWIRVKELRVTNSAPIDPAIFEIPARLVNPNASDSAKRLMSFLTDAYGRVMLSGQYSDPGLFAGEAGIIFMETGKRPAVLGLDLIDYSPSRVEFGAESSTIERAIEAWEAGAIVTFCWHWNAPTPYITGPWYRAFYTYATDINLKKIMDGDDPEGYDLLMSDIDEIAELLKILQDHDIPILWRPLHEAAGRWFWWGASGIDPYIQLWRLMYERLTFEHELNNLIWLWNGEHKDWYPGDDYVDIIGEDIYAGEHAYASQIQKFLEAVRYTYPHKLVTLSENGTLIDPDLAWRDGAMWGFWATWEGDFVRQGGLWRYSEKFTELDMLHHVYNHPRVVTLEDMPCLQTYPIRED